MISIMRMRFMLLLAVGILALAACAGGAEEETAYDYDDAESSKAYAGGSAPAPAAPAPAAPAPAATAAPAAPMAAPAPTRASAGPGLPGQPGMAQGYEPMPFSVPPMAPAQALESKEDYGFSDETPFSEENVASLVVQQRIIVRTVDMGIVVADVSASLDSIARLAQEEGGWVVSSKRSQKHQGAISIRVPADRLDQTILRLREMAVEVESELLSSEDVTDEYVDTTARLKNLQATEEALLRLLSRAEEVEEALKVQESLTQTQGEIERLQGRIKFLEQTSAFSLVNVTVEMEPVEMVVDAGADRTSGVREAVRFRATFNPPEGIDEFLVTWDLGDGSRLLSSARTAPTEDEDARTTATVTHYYDDEQDSPFIAEVEITGTGDAGVAEGKDTIIITVLKRPSIEVFATEMITVEEGEELELDGSFTRPEGLTEVEYSWDFGDGTTHETGILEESVTNAVATHVYLHHRPFPYRATLTITAQSEAGEIEADTSVDVRVTESKGWVIAGWSLQDQGKTAVRMLSGTGQFAGSVLIWLLIFSPVWAVVGIVGVVATRRMRHHRSQSANDSD